MDVARDVVGLHSSDPSTVYLSAWTRLREPSLAAVDRALYEDRSLIRMLAMRRTMFVVPVVDAPILHAAASVEVAKRERERNREILAMAGIDGPAADAWLRRAERETLEALDRRGEATTQQLAEDFPPWGPRCA